jgi:catechol 2,3-dioxygenase-like lactoylglutathione lyase family enzyme
MKVIRVQHISVNCEGRLDETRRFYGEVFELPDIPRPEIPGIGGRWLGLGDAQLHLVDAAPRPSGIDPVADHWCVEVADIDAARSELADRGIEYVEGAQGPVVQLWIHDPVGRVVEIQQAR